MGDNFGGMDLFITYVGGDGNDVTLVTTLALPGDVNLSGHVSGDDLAIIITNWGMTGATREQGDLSGDNTVSGLDYTEVITYYGTGVFPGEPGTIPEPATLEMLLMVGALAMLRGRR